MCLFPPLGIFSGGWPLFDEVSNCLFLLPSAEPEPASAGAIRSVGRTAGGGGGTTHDGATRRGGATTSGGATTAGGGGATTAALGGVTTAGGAAITAALGGGTTAVAGILHGGIPGFACTGFACGELRGFGTGGTGAGTGFACTGELRGFGTCGTGAGTGGSSSLISVFGAAAEGAGR